VPEAIKRPLPWDRYRLQHQARNVNSVLIKHLMNKNTDENSLMQK
jgi:hypothetical protein